MPPLGDTPGSQGPYREMTSPLSFPFISIRDAHRETIHYSCSCGISFIVATVVVDADVLISPSCWLWCNVTYMLQTEIVTSSLCTSGFPWLTSSPGCCCKRTQKREMLIPQSRKPQLPTFHTTAVFSEKQSPRCSGESQIRQGPFQSQGSISWIQGYTLKCILWVTASEKPKSYLGNVLVPWLALDNLLGNALPVLLCSAEECRDKQNVLAPCHLATKQISAIKCFYYNGRWKICRWKVLLSPVVWFSVTSCFPFSVSHFLLPICPALSFYFLPPRVELSNIHF